MNKNMLAWVERLETTTAAQGRGMLRSEDDRYCCLGIACQLAVEAGVIPPPEFSCRGPYLYDGEAEVLPVPVQRWLGVDSAKVYVMFTDLPPEPVLDTPDTAGVDLAALNDRGASFGVIAKVIRHAYADQDLDVEATRG